MRADGDHNILEITIRLKGTDATDQNRIKRNWKNINWERFQESAASIQWEELYQIDNLDVANKWLDDKLVNLLDLEAPWVTIQNRKNYRN